MEFGNEQIIRNNLIVEGNLRVRGTLVVETLGEPTINELILETQTIASEDNNIELNYGGTHETAKGGGIKLLNAIKGGGDSELRIDENGRWIVTPSLATPQLSLPEYSPISTNDKMGDNGDTVWDDDYIYIKTKKGWKRTSLENF